MKVKMTLLAFYKAMVLPLLITQQVCGGQLPPICQTWNSTAVVCRGQGGPWDYPTRATLTQVPPGIPVSIVTLDLSGNNITELYPNSFVGLTALRYLSLSQNNIAKIHNGSFNGLRNLRNLDLSDTGIQAIEIGAFAGLKNLERLDMSCSMQHSTFALQTGLFTDLRNLKYLALETSTEKVEVDVFKDLTRLRYLYLGLSSLRRLPDHVFDSLTLLENLTMVERDIQSGSEFLHRNQLWSPLLKLRTFQLFVQSVENLNFGAVFRHLPNLEEIQLCSIHESRVRYSVEMFLPLVSTLKRLDLRCSAHVFVETDDVLTLEPGLLTSLTQLKSLDIPWTQFSYIADVLPELRHTRVQEMFFVMDGINIIKADTMATMQGLDELKTLSISLPDTQVIAANSFTSFTHLQRLNLAVGMLHTIEDNAFTGLSSVTHLELSHNLISTLPHDVFEGLSSLNHLDLSYNNLETSQARLPETLDYLDLSHNNINSYINMETVNIAISFNLTDVKSVNHLNLSYNRLQGVESPSLPANLTVLDLQHNEIGYFLPESLFSIAGLTYLDLSHNDIRTTSLATIQSPTLETLRLDNNGLEGIDGEFTKGLKKLKTLTLSHNHIRVIGKENLRWLVQLVQLDLSHNEISTLKSLAFRGLSRLKSLDLSNNKIQNMTAMTFAGLDKLRILNLAANRIAVTGDAFQHLYGLRHLILSGNRLSVLNQTSLGSVVNRLERLDVADNPFLCDCKLWWFVVRAQDKYDKVLNWYNPYPRSYQSYKCFRPAKLYGQRLVDGITTQEDEGKAQTQSMFFDMDCSHEFRPNRLLACVLASSGIFVAMMTVFLVDYNIEHVRYCLWLWAKWRKPRIGEEGINEQYECTHDAFIAYSNEDVKWVINEAIENLEPDYNLLIHDRDFAVGAPIVENIADAVEHSRRTVCLITRNFLKSKWCEHEFQLAQYHMFEQGGGVRLILVFLEEIPTRMLKRYRHLNAVVKRDTYLAWPRDVRKRPLFWRRLRDALGEPLPRDPEPQEQVPTPEQLIPEQERNIPEQKAQSQRKNVPEQKKQGNVLESQGHAPVRNIPEHHLFNDTPEQQDTITPERGILEQQVHVQERTQEPRNTEYLRMDSEDGLIESESEDDWCGIRSDILLLPL
ncbi:uncharacterized protein LOC144914516 [Branchiostoma floridae x Branchiostoma belcheri]